MSTPALPHILTEEDRVAIRLTALNDCAPEMARAQFRRCCGSTKWVQNMEQARPFSNLEELEACANRIWWACSSQDWLEAFAGHPRIGENSESRWAQQEQSSVAGATSPVLRALAEANRAYETKFGFTFIVCATGKSASEILEMLQYRLSNSATIEIQNAAREQRMIPQLRLPKLLAEWM